MGAFKDNEKYNETIDYNMVYFICVDISILKYYIFISIIYKY